MWSIKIFEYKLFANQIKKKDDNYILGKYLSKKLCNSIEKAASNESKQLFTEGVLLFYRLSGVFNSKWYVFLAIVDDFGVCYLCI